MLILFLGWRWNAWLCLLARNTVLQASEPRQGTPREKEAAVGTETGEHIHCGTFCDWEERIKSNTNCP